MKSLINQTFFRFLARFVIILAVSFSVIFIVGYFVVGEEQGVAATIEEQPKN